MRDLDINVFGVLWRLHCADPPAAALLSENFHELLTAGGHEPTSHIWIRPCPDEGQWLIETESGSPVAAQDTYELVYLVEKIVTVNVQTQRSDLYFLHAAALAYRGGAILLVAASGSGKSTTAWALANRGFGYLSDELAPIDLDTLEVEPYPHALCLKARPPPPFDVPDGTIVTSRTLHVPTARVPMVIHRRVTLRAIFFNRFDRAAATPSVSALRPAECGALLYSQALNPLAHHRDGLKAVATIAGRVASYALTTCDLEATCALIRQTLDELLARPAQ